MQNLWNVLIKWLPPRKLWWIWRLLICSDVDPHKTNLNCCPCWYKEVENTLIEDLCESLLSQRVKEVTILLTLNMSIFGSSFFNTRLKCIQLYCILLSLAELSWAVLSSAETYCDLKWDIFVDYFKHCDLCHTKIKTFQKRNTKSFPIDEVKRRKRDIAKGSQESCSLYKRSYRFETGPEGWNCWWFSNYGRRVVFLWVSTYPQDPYDFSHTLLLLRKKERKNYSVPFLFPQILLT